MPLNSFVSLTVASPSNEEIQQCGIISQAPSIGSCLGWILGPLLAQSELWSFCVYVELSRQWGPCCPGALFPDQLDGLLAVFYMAA